MKTRTLYLILFVLTLMMAWAAKNLMASESTAEKAAVTYGIVAPDKD